MPIKKPRNKVKLHIGQIEGQGVDIQKVLGGLSNMKTELEGLGCQVSIKVQGVELAGNETRTRDILLGNNSVAPTRENNLDTDLKHYYVGYAIKDLSGEIIYTGAQNLTAVNEDVAQAIIIAKKRVPHTKVEVRFVELGGEVI